MQQQKPCCESTKHWMDESSSKANLWKERQEVKSSRIYSLHMIRIQQSTCIPLAVKNLCNPCGNVACQVSHFRFNHTAPHIQPQQNRFYNNTLKANTEYKQDKVMAFYCSSSQIRSRPICKMALLLRACEKLRSCKTL